MLLVVDVGNTQTHFGTYSGDELLEHWRFATVRTSTADELGAALRALLELRGIGLADLNGSIVASSVPQLEPEWISMGRRYLGHEMLAVGPGLRTGMPIRIDNPRELGADRLADAVAAYDHVGGPVISVDFGTAVNYDVVSGKGEYLGGVITPGVAISLDALTTRGARLPKIDLVPPRHAIGKGTVEAIRSGIVYGYAAQVDGLVARIKKELEGDAAVLATGGLASVIAPYTATIDTIVEDLTLRGLKLLHDRNSA